MLEHLFNCVMLKEIYLEMEINIKYLSKGYLSPENSYMMAVEPKVKILSGSLK